jgi:hypothetical protein
MSISAISKIVPFFSRMVKPAAAAGKFANIGNPYRMAGSAAFQKGLGKALFGEMTKGDIAMRLAPDVFFGGMAAMQTPGDIGDKMIAGGTQLVGGGLGGLALGRVGHRMGAGPGLETLLDMGGSVGGDFAGMAVGDVLQRGKDKLMGGEGQTAWERMGAQEQQAFADQIRQQTLMGLPGAGMGYMPGVQDQYLAELGLG